MLFHCRMNQPDNDQGDYDSSYHPAEFGKSLAQGAILALVYILYLLPAIPTVVHFCPPKMVKFTPYSLIIHPSKTVVNTLSPAMKKPQSEGLCGFGVC